MLEFWLGFTRCGVLFVALGYVAVDLLLVACLCLLLGVIWVLLCCVFVVGCAFVVMWGLICCVGVACFRLPVRVLL